MTNKEKCIFLPILGKTNVGKSTLFNKLIKKKISITSKKKNTTKNNIFGIDTDKKNNIQYIYIDTPGFNKIINFKKYINYYINIPIKYFNFNKIKIIILVIEINIDFYEIQLIKNLKKIKILVFINKIDKIKKKILLLPFIKKIQKNKNIYAIFFTSKKEKLNINIIKKYFKKFLKKKKFIYKKHIKTDCDTKFVLKEIIREKIIRLTGDEIPYTTKIIINSIIKNNKSQNIIASIIVKKKQHIPILIGSKGKKIKKIIKLSQISSFKYFNKKTNFKIKIKNS